MPQKNPAQGDVLEIVMFEQWLRFYFVEEREDKLFVNVPQQVEMSVSEAEPHLTGLMEMLNQREITQQTSTEAVCSYVASRLDGARYPEGTCSRLLDSREFKLEMYLFNLWLTTHEAKLEGAEKVFDLWRSEFLAWRESSEVREYVAKLLVSSGKSSQATH